MPHKLHKNRDAIRLLEQVLEAAEDGDVTDVFIVYRKSDREYGHCFAADNLGDMILQAGTALMTARIDEYRREPTKH